MIDKAESTTRTTGRLMVVVVDLVLTPGWGGPRTPGKRHRGTWQSCPIQANDMMY